MAFRRSVGQTISASENQVREGVTLGKCGLTKRPVRRPRKHVCPVGMLSVRDFFNFRPIFHKLYRDAPLVLCSQILASRRWIQCVSGVAFPLSSRNTTNMIRKPTTRPKTSCEDAEGFMPQRPVRISRGSTPREQGSRSNADMNLCVAETQERDDQTPTLSGEAMREEGENLIRSKSLVRHQHGTMTRVGIRVLMLLSYHSVNGCHPRTEMPPVYPCERRMKEPWTTET